MEIRILGPLEVRDAEGPVRLGGPQQRALLALLVIRRGEVVSTDRLVDELWPEQQPPAAVKTVQIYVSQLRRALGDGALSTHGRGYRLELGPADVDAAMPHDAVRARVDAVDPAHAALAAVLRPHRPAPERQVAAPRVRDLDGRHDPVRPRVDPVQRAVAVAGDPHGAEAGADRAGEAGRGDGSGVASGVCVASGVRVAAACPPPQPAISRATTIGAAPPARGRSAVRQTGPSVMARR